MKKIRAFSFILALFMAITLLFSYAQPAYAASVKTNLTTKIKFTRSGSTYVTRYKYNSKGLVTQKITYQPDGTQQLKVSYSYGTNNLVKSATISEFGTKAASVQYTYNSKNQLTKRVSKNVSSGATVTATYTYNSKGLLSKSIQAYKNSMMYEDGTKITKVYTYNSNGVLSKIKRTYSNDKTLNRTTGYKYDKNGFLKKYTYTSSDESGYISRNLVYDSAGKLTKYRDTDHCTYDGEEYTDKDAYRIITSETQSLSKSLSAIATKQQQEIINGSYGTDLYLGYDNPI